MTHSLAVWLYLAVAIPYTLFVVLYAFVSRPRDPLGHSLLLSKSVIAVLSWHVVVSLAWPGYPGQDVVRAFVVGCAIVAGWWQLYLLLSDQRNARLEKEKTHGRHPR